MDFPFAPGKRRVVLMTSHRLWSNLPRIKEWGGDSA